MKNGFFTQSPKTCSFFHKQLLTHYVSLMSCRVDAHGIHTCLYSMTINSSPITCGIIAISSAVQECSPHTPPLVSFHSHSVCRLTRWCVQGHDRNATVDKRIDHYLVTTVYTQIMSLKKSTASKVLLGWQSCLN